jgi:hypothetical protein
MAIQGILEKGAATKLLEEFLERVPVHGEVHFDKLSEVANTDIRENRWVLARVRRKLERRGIVFDCLRGKGIKRVDSAGALGVGVSHGKRAKRALGRGAQVLATVKPDDLTDNAKREFNTALVQITVASSVMGSRRKVLGEVRLDQPHAKQIAMRLFGKAIDEATKK